MDTRILPVNLLNEKISDLLSEYPQLLNYFLRHHTACIGCGFSSFCNLRDAMNIYDMDTKSVMREIQQFIQNIIQSN